MDPDSADRDPKPADTEAKRLEELLASWFEHAERGQLQSPEECCKDAPELLDAFRNILESDLALEASVAKNAKPRGSGALEGQHLGEFQILKKIGSGGRGDVYLARQPALGRFVAIKVLRTEMSGTARARRRLFREAELAASLEHPNIVPIYGVGECDEQAYLAMKWLKGPILSELRDPLEGRSLARLGAKIARALHAAHIEGVTHRDIKPANVMFDEGEPYILDFGLASGTVDMTITFDGKVSGTLPYMSPEQLCAGGRTTPLDGRTDIYSLGAT
ncbi:MAG: serine/threonine protein kinase, partial [Planctomycetes bacterium]|nr:serine/threonine protein kinase [Planctomycetota bacterium]